MILIQTESMYYGYFIKIVHVYFGCFIFITGGKKSSFNRNSTPGPLEYLASALTAALLGPNILTDTHTPVKAIICVNSK